MRSLNAYLRVKKIKFKSTAKVTFGRFQTSQN